MTTCNSPSFAARTPGGSIAAAIDAARAYVAEHPDQAGYTDSAATAVLETDLRCRVEGPSGATAATDMPTGIGGGGSAPSPGWFLRAAQASCEATVIAMRAAELGIALQRLEVVVDSQSDDRGLLGMGPSVPAGPLSSRILVRIAADDVPPEVLAELLEYADEHSPVTDAIRRAVPMTVEVESLVGEQS